MYTHCDGWHNNRLQNASTLFIKYFTNAANIQSWYGNIKITKSINGHHALGAAACTDHKN